MTSYANTSPRQSSGRQRNPNPSTETERESTAFTLDRDGRVQNWGTDAELVYGYSASEMVGRHVDVFFPPEAQAAGQPSLLLRRSASVGHAEDEGWRIRKDGSRFWSNLLITGLTNGQGNLLGHVIVTRVVRNQRPITQRIRRRDELLQTEERFRLLVESVQDYAIFMLDANGIVSTWNSGAERIKGYKADEIIGRHFSVFRPPEEAEAGVCERELSAAARDGKLEEEGWRVRKDGTRFWANVVLTAIFGQDGRLIGFAKVVRDLTQRQLLDGERLQRARAEEAVRLRDEFLLVASHELRTPLTSLRLDLYGMQQDLVRDPSKLDKKLERAVRNSDRLAALIESLLNVSRLAHGKLVLKPVEVDLVQLVLHSADGIRSQALKAGCEVGISAARAVPGIWDGLRLEQVFMNLLSNAVKYGAGFPVDIKVLSDSDGARVEISDRGPGIPEGDLERIFDRFERSSAARNVGGLGLGLYVSRELIRAHGGSISASNRSGGGATFTVRLPTTSQTAPEAA